MSYRFKYSFLRQMATDIGLSIFQKRQRIHILNSLTIRQISGIYIENIRYQHFPVKV